MRRDLALRRGQTAQTFSSGEAPWWGARTEGKTMKTRRIGLVFQRSPRRETSVSRHQCARERVLLRQKNLAYYNLERSHQGFRLMGRTPAHALREALHIEDLPPLF
jgi:hypothetical protein